MSKIEKGQIWGLAYGVPVTITEAVDYGDAGGRVEYVTESGLKVTRSYSIFKGWADAGVAVLLEGALPRRGRASRAGEVSDMGGGAGARKGGSMNRAERRAQAKAALRKENKDD